LLKGRVHHGLTRDVIDYATSFSTFAKGLRVSQDAILLASCLFPVITWVTPAVQSRWAPTRETALRIYTLGAGQPFRVAALQPPKRDRGIRSNGRDRLIHADDTFVIYQPTGLRTACDLHHIRGSRGWLNKLRMSCRKREQIDRERLYVGVRLARRQISGTRFR
jgi:hypothetical protein